MNVNFNKEQMLSLYDSLDELARAQLSDTKIVNKSALTEAEISDPYKTLISKRSCHSLSLALDRFGYVDAKNESGESPLHYLARECGYVKSEDILNLLIEYKVNFLAKNNNGQYAWEVAKETIKNKELDKDYEGLIKSRSLNILSKIKAQTNAEKAKEESLCLHSKQRAPISI